MTLTSTSNRDALGKLVIRAQSDYSSVWLYLARDTWGRKHDGSVYYWSNNMMIATVLFDTEQEALVKLNRLKIKDKVTCIQVVPFVPGVQIVRLDGKEV